jgi:hypothetical protein
VKDKKMGIKDLGESVQSGTDNLKRGRYLRNADSVGWDLCLARQCGLATAVYAKIFIM